MDNSNNTPKCIKCSVCNRFKIFGSVCYAELKEKCELEEKFFILEPNENKINTAPIEISLIAAEGQSGNHPDYSCGRIITTFEVTFKIEKEFFEKYYSKKLDLKDLLELIEARK